MPSYAIDCHVAFQSRASGFGRAGKPILRRTRRRAAATVGLLATLVVVAAPLHADDRVSKNDDLVKISLPDVEAAIRRQGYVSGVAAQSLLDKKTGFRDAGFGLDIVDWIME